VSNHISAALRLIIFVDALTWLPSIVHWCVDAIYDFRDSAKSVGYNLACGYGFQTKNPNIQQNADLYKKYETSDRVFMDAYYADDDVSPFINQALMSQLREVVYCGPYAIARHMITVFHVLPILHELAPYLLWNQGGNSTGYTLTATGVKYHYFDPFIPLIS
jgi:hypothetical protein